MNSLIETITLAKELSKEETLLLVYKLEYPHITNDLYESFVNQVNVYYAQKTNLLVRFRVQKMYQYALEEFLTFDRQNRAFPYYQLFSVFTVTCNEDCLLSTYTDVYEYTGGAHGNTIRESSSWNFLEKKKLSLEDFFSKDYDYEEYSINTILSQIESDINNNKDIYFENYEENVRKAFQKNNFYFTKEGIVLYFQQYEIGPYVSGIISFTLPFDETFIVRPTCIKPRI